MDSSLVPFFRPRGVIVAGVSHDPAKLGFGLARNLVESGYQGEIHFVNPRGGRLLERPVHQDLSTVPAGADLAVLLIPAPAVPDALRACGRLGVRAAIVLSGGFREVGPDGAALEAECTRAAGECGMRLLGPNCVGLINTHLPIDLTFLRRPGPPPGEIAFVSHSGAVCAVVTDQAGAQGFGMSSLISLGNQADLTETDVLVPVAEDPHTRVIVLYLEGIVHGRRFVEQASQVSRRIPIVAMKVGRSTGGRRAVASHTGALAGQDTAYDAAFRRAGVIRADTSEQLFDWARALAWCRLPAGRDMAVLTNAGGPGAIAVDALETYGLRLAVLGERTRASLRDLVPSAAIVHNPVDILASASPEQYARCLRHLLDDAAVHGVLVILPAPPSYEAGAVAAALVAETREAAKPVVVALLGGASIRGAAELLRASRVPDYPTPERAASALAALARRAEVVARSAALVDRPDGVPPETARDLLAACSTQPGEFVSQEDAGRLLAAYGIAVPRVELARTASEAAALAADIGFPVALKIALPDVPHKSDIGGVLLNVADRAAAIEGFARICENAGRARPGASVLGVYVQPMLPAGQEVIIGAVRDPQFGPLVMFGSGGVEVEGLRDVAFDLAPLSRRDAGDLVDRTWAGRRLRGYRHVPPGDREAVIDGLMRVAQLAADCPDLSEIEINPLLVLRAGQGAIAVDVRARKG
jgi:acetyltransferase